MWQAGTLSKMPAILGWQGAGWTGGSSGVGGASRERAEQTLEVQFHFSHTYQARNLFFSVGEFCDFSSEPRGEVLSTSPQTWLSFQCSSLGVIPVFRYP